MIGANIVDACFFSVYCCDKHVKTRVLFATIPTIFPVFFPYLGKMSVKVFAFLERQE